MWSTTRKICDKSSSQWRICAFSTPSRTGWKPIPKSQNETKFLKMPCKSCFLQPSPEESLIRSPETFVNSFKWFLGAREDTQASIRRTENNDDDRMVLVSPNLHALLDSEEEFIYKRGRKNTIVGNSSTYTAFQGWQKACTNLSPTSIISN